MSEETPVVAPTEESQPTTTDPVADPVTEELPADEVKPEPEPEGDGKGIDLSTVKEELNKVSAEPAATTEATQGAEEIKEEVAAQETPKEETTATEATSEE